ncbi:patatin-like phospholipase family protein [Hansschlegelia quercus]|uniref:Patatin-like phospholipase family protein n=1 Tax=Hansschlegelia quercus TaxID=2528245 RepID=A0A4V2JEG3_9HYPH|nr:patatin-like phospholipase family protein [Hansschlegelia quercus]TBN55146.1 patatin-like phospholipase family protein [Hansschlegelia quercus]
MSASPERRIGLALGGGGARGLAHLHVLAAFDDLGVRPAVIAGSSIGALIGACYAAGLTGGDLREHVEGQLRRRADVVAKLMRARVGRITDLFGAGSRNPMLLDGEALIQSFLPPEIPSTIEELPTPFTATATDFFERRGIGLDKGALAPALAASAAIPGMFRPVSHDGRVLIDGAMTNPLPFDLLGDRADVVMAIDVTGGPVPGGRAPNVFETMLGATQIMQTTIVDAMIAQRPPDSLIRPNVAGVTLLDFFKSAAALRASQPAREEAKREIERLMRG